MRDGHARLTFWATRWCWWRMGPGRPRSRWTPASDLAGMLAGGKLSMAMVDSVPAGQYGKEALTALGAVGQRGGQRGAVGKRAGGAAAGRAGRGALGDRLCHAMRWQSRG